MKFKRLNIDWNAEPNAPHPVVSIEGKDLVAEFTLNYFLYETFKEDQRGKLVFRNCHKFSFNSMNDEGYYRGQYRYKYTELPWGEFYELETDWRNDFHQDVEFLSPENGRDNLKHYIFFLRDNTLECVAEGWEFLPD